MEADFKFSLGQRVNVKSTTVLGHVESLMIDSDQSTWALLKYENNQGEIITRWERETQLE